jgi:rhamnulokinase/L-fuculokinase
VIAVCGHDTQSAVSAVPAAEKDFVFISSGTWSLFGTEPDAPAAGERSRKCNFTNEGGVDYATAFLKNICGLWLIQESRRQWKREGKDFSFAALEEAALQAKPFKCFIDPDAPDFVQPGDMPGRIRDYCLRTGQEAPANEGETVRCIYESLALKYRDVFAQMRYCTGKTFSRLHIVGGGSQDATLNRMAADACGVPVFAGPTEATVLGNVAVQLISRGALRGVDDARAAIARSFSLSRFDPENGAAWDAAAGRYKEITHGI